jgi:uroporphyrinogen-III decarboxylase
MHAKERVYSAISGSMPDRVPVIPKMWVDLAANITGTDLKAILISPDRALRVMLDAGLACRLDAVRMWHFPKKNIKDDNGEIIECDQKGKPIGVVDMLGGLVTHLTESKSFDIQDPYMMAHHHYWTCERPIIENVEEVTRMYVPTKSDYIRFGWKDRMQEYLSEAGDKIEIIGDCDSPTLAFCISFRGMNHALLDLLDQPELAEAIMDKGTEIAIERAKFNIDLGLRVLRLNDSAGNMSVISPALWRHFIKPRLKRFCEEVHAYNSDARIYCHICGNVMPIIEDLIETGLDCIAPLDPLGGFSVAQAKQKVGKRVSLMGGVNTMSLLNGTPDQIIEEAKLCIEGAGCEGGYILGSGCVVPRGASKENILALVDAADRYGSFRR